MRRWLLAYPPRWRWQRADEVVGTLADLAPAGATRLDVRSGVELVVHGLATRRRMRPPLRYTLRFGLLNTALPWQYRGWVADRIASPIFTRGPLAGFALYMAVMTALRTIGGEAATADLFFAGAVAVACMVTPRSGERRQAAARHLVARPGEPGTPWDLRSAWVCRDRGAARSRLPTLAAAGGLVAMGAITMTIATRSGRAGPLAVCGVVGCAIAARLAVRWRRCVPTRPAQPARRLLGVGPAWRASAGSWCAVTVGAVLSWPLTGLASTTSLAPVLLSATLVIVPSLVVGWFVARRGPDDLAMVDVWRLLAGRGPLPVDAVQRGYVPAWEAPPAPGAVPLMGGPPALPPTPGTA